MPRARIRRLTWASRLILGVIFVFLPGGLLLPFVLGGLGMSIEDYFDRVFLWQLVATAVVVLGGVALAGRVGRSLEEAAYADARKAVGRVDEVVETDPGGGDFSPSYDLVISAVIAGPLTIRRRVAWGATSALAPTWVGRHVRFRYNTRDPEDLNDILFLGFADEKDDGRR